MFVPIKKFRLGEMFGIPMYVDISFAILLLLFISNSGGIFTGVCLAVLLAVSVLLHELGHSLMARVFGYDTKDITISLVGGCASLMALPGKAWQEFMTAIAGPLVSFAIALISFVILSTVPIANEVIYSWFYYLYVLNMMLGIFNLLPALPMDGGRIFRSLLRMKYDKVKSTYIAMYVGRVIAVALIVLPLLGIYNIWIFPIGGSFFIRALIAWMIWQESKREYLLAAAEGSRWHWDQGDFRARVSPRLTNDEKELRSIMKIADIIESLNGTLVAGGDSNRSVGAVVANDLMSDVLLNDSEDILLLTSLASDQAIRTANIVGAMCVVVHNDKPLPQTMCQVADNLGIPLVSSRC